jgi:eukaryotic-like serine/threonine-protein kinase
VNPKTECCAQCGCHLPADAPPGACPQCALLGALALDPEASASSISESAVGDPGTPVDGPLQFGLIRTLGDYELLEEIGRGGMGVVYKARQKSLNRTVAVKMILSGRFASKQEVLRFRGEAEAAGRLRHPNIVTIYETGEHDGHHFFSMDFVQGRSLAEIVREGSLPAQRAARYVRIVATAIHYAHEQGILHRDLKPSNVLVDGNDEPRVTDFGLAKRLHGDFGLTVTGQVLGSPNFMPPEQTGAWQAKVGPQSDVYGLGAILYHLLTGRPPFQAETIAEILRQLRDQELVSPRLLNPSLPRDLETICLKCLEKEPAKRYVSAQALACELQRFLENVPIQARPVSWIAKAWRWCQRKPAFAGLSAATVILVLAVAIGSPVAAFLINRERRQDHENLYAADIRDAQAAWERGNVGHARDLLHLHEPRSNQQDSPGFEWRYLTNLCAGSQLCTWRWHSQVVGCVAFSPDGGKLASGSSDSTVHIVDVASRKHLGSWTAHRGQVVALTFSTDGRLLATAGSDDTVKLWNAATGQQIASTNLQAARLAFSPVTNVLAIATGDPTMGGSVGDVILWDYTRPDQTRTLLQAGSRLAFSSDGLQLATGSCDNSIKLWNVATGLPMLSLTHDNALAAVALAFSPDHRWLAASSFYLNDITLWDLKTGRAEVLSEHHQKVWSLCFSPDSTLLASGSADQSILLWDLATRRPRVRLKGHGSEVMTVAFARDGQLLASGGRDNTVRLWSVKTNQSSEPIADYRGGCTWPLFSADGGRFFNGTANHTIEVWEIASHQRLAVLPNSDFPLAVSDDNLHLVALSLPTSLQHWNLSGPVLEQSLPLVEGPSEPLPFAISLHGTLLAASYNDCTVGIWNTKTGQRIRAWQAHEKHIFCVAFSPDGRLLATCSRDYTAKIWEVATGHLKKTLTDHHSAVFQAIFLDQGKMLATASGDGTAILWDAITWEPKGTLTGHQGPVGSIALSPDGRTLATGSFDQTVKLWSWTTQREMLTLNTSEGTDFTGFSPDGTTLAAWNRAGYLRLWHVP